MRAFNRAIRVRAAADLIMDIPTPPPLGTYPRVREVVEFHVNAIRDRLAGKLDTAQAWTPIGDEFVGGAAGRIRRRGHGDLGRDAAGDRGGRDR